MRINVEVNVDSKGVATFRQIAGEAENAEKKVKGLADATGLLGNVVKGVAQGFGQRVFDAIVSGVSAIPSAVMSSVESMLKLADTMSNLSGVTGIGVEALQKFQFAGAAVGVSVEQIAQSMGAFQRKLVEGSDNTLAALNKLGLSREALANMVPEEQLTTVLSALNEKIPNAANRTALAFELLGKSGAALLPLGADLETIMAKAEELGIVMSQQDVAAADALGDSAGALSATFGGLVNSIGAVITSNASLHALVEGLQTVVAGLTKFVQDNRAALSEWVTGGVEFVVRAMLFMVDTVGVLMNAWDGLRLTWLSAKNVAADLAISVLEVAKAMETSRQALTEGLGNQFAPGLGTALAGEGPSAASKAYDEQIAKLKSLKDEVALEAGAVVDGSAQKADALGKVRKLFEDLEGKVLKAHGTQLQFAGSLKTGAVVLETNAAALKKLADQQDAWWKSVEQADEAQQRAHAATVAWYAALTGPGAAQVEAEVLKITQAFEEQGGRAGHTAEQIENLRKKLASLRETSAEGFNAGNAGSGGIAGNIMLKVTQDAPKAGSDAGKAAGEGFKATFSKALDSLPGVILGAIQGGGDVGKSIGAHLGGSIGEGLKKPITDGLTKIIGPGLGKALGGLAGPLGSILGSGLGSVLGKALGGLFKSEGKEVNRMRDQFIAAAGGLDALAAKAKAAGTNVDALLKADKVKEFQAAVAGLNGAFGLQAEAQQKTQAAIEKYGFTIGELGPKFQQQKLDEMAASLIEDYKLLTAAGIEQNTVVGKMAPAFQEYVTTALEAGAALPASMKPMIEQLIANGQLLDKNGQAFESVEQAGLSFTETLTEGLSRAVDAINNLVAALTGVRSPGPINIPVNVVGTGNGDGPWMPGQLPQFATGSGGFQHFGPGTMAMLHGTEAVVRPSDLTSTGPISGMLRAHGWTNTSTTAAAAAAGRSRAQSGGGDMSALLAELVALRREVAAQKAPVIMVGQEKLGEIIDRTHRRTGR